MLSLSSNLQDKINNSTVAPFTLISLSFSSPVYITDAASDISYGGHIYTADGGIVGVTPPGAQGEVNRDVFVLALNDPDNELRSALDSENVGVKVAITAGFFDVETRQNINEYLSIYKGQISSVSWRIEDSSPIVTIQCTGPLTKLSQVINRTTNETSQKLLYPNDTSMDKSYDSDSKQTISWGG
jgi:hypothetical protein